jgi:hypothetical protein
MHKKYVSIAFASLLLLGFSFGLRPAAAATTMTWAGCRASNYGIKPYPTPEGWVSAITQMSGHWSGSIPSTVWLVGEIQYSGGHKICILHFPNPTPGTTYPNILFDDIGINHEAYFTYFDTHGVKVFLSCEPANADVSTLIDICMKAFAQHQCIIGFGIDTEWYQSAKYRSGKPVTDAEAQAWETKLKSYNSSYKLWLKHWLASHMPPTYRGSIIFNDDSQGFGSLTNMVSEFTVWASTFYPNPVHFQVGYGGDKKWWKAYADPPKTIGDAIIAALPSTQQCGVFWVDFTLRDVFPGV